LVNLGPKMNKIGDNDRCQLFENFEIIVEYPWQTSD